MTLASPPSTSLPTSTRRRSRSCGRATFSCRRCVCTRGPTCLSRTGKGLCLQWFCAKTGAKKGAKARVRAARSARRAETEHRGGAARVGTTRPTRPVQPRGKQGACSVCCSTAGRARRAWTPMARTSLPTSHCSLEISCRSFARIGTPGRSGSPGWWMRCSSRTRSPSTSRARRGRQAPWRSVTGSCPSTRGAGGSTLARSRA
mmetsp:Transcript_46554/g.111974  ORF Transcript_46554/g.111974 Transcript_46554/m.111974 type:complete len:203 (-) Transcript_46554:223-831(-)